MLWLSDKKRKDLNYRSNLFGVSLALNTHHIVVIETVQLWFCCHAITIKQAPWQLSNSMCCGRSRDVFVTSTTPHQTHFMLLFHACAQTQWWVCMNLLWSLWVWGPGWLCRAGTSPRLWRWEQASWRTGRPQSCGCLRRSPAVAPHLWWWECSWRFFKGKRHKRHLFITTHHDRYLELLTIMIWILYCYWDVQFVRMDLKKTSYYTATKFCSSSKKQVLYK